MRMLTDFNWSVGLEGWPNLFYVLIKFRILYKQAFNGGLNNWYFLKETVYHGLVELRS